MCMRTTDRAKYRHCKCFMQHKLAGAAQTTSWLYRNEMLKDYMPTLIMSVYLHKPNTFKVDVQYVSWVLNKKQRQRTLTRLTLIFFHACPRRTSSSFLAGVVSDPGSSLGCVPPFERQRKPFWGEMFPWTCRICIIQELTHFRTAILYHQNRSPFTFNRRRTIPDSDILSCQDVPHNHTSCNG